ncbi:hypothetical protein BHM03_00039846 [Ensete ventricosum]|nr:hypothetical protein BHM03_00039846 [Ensete ventricosum]
MSTADVERGAAAASGKTRGAVANGYRFPGNYQSQFYYDPGASAEREWTSWIVPLVVVANVAMFVVTMYINNCPGHRNIYGSCVAGFLHRFSFQPLRENPLFGPSSSTYVPVSVPQNVRQSRKIRLIGIPASIYLIALDLEKMDNKDAMGSSDDFDASVVDVLDWQTSAVS